MEDLARARVSTQGNMCVGGREGDTVTHLVYLTLRGSMETGFRFCMCQEELEQIGRVQTEVNVKRP